MIGYSPVVRDLISELLADRRSATTRAAYTQDLKYFFRFIQNSDPSPALVEQFLSMSRADAVSLVGQYKKSMIDRSLAEATINRRLASIRALVNYAQEIDKCAWNLGNIKAEKIRAYRDTTGIEPAAFKKILELPDRTTIIGKRDYAILRLLWDNALRRGEAAAVSIEDLDFDSRRLWILGKGRGSQKEAVSLTAKSMDAIANYLKERGKLNPKAPLFVSHSRNQPGHRLTTTAIYMIVRDYSIDAGITKPMSPHRIRHSSITAALESSGGDVRRVQKLSRHAKLDTLMIYDDNRRNLQGEISDLLADLV